MIECSIAKERNNCIKERKKSRNTKRKKRMQRKTMVGVQIVSVDIVSSVDANKDQIN